MMQAMPLANDQCNTFDTVRGGGEYSIRTNIRKHLLVSKCLYWKLLHMAVCLSNPYRSHLIFSIQNSQKADFPFKKAKSTSLLRHFSESVTLYRLNWLTMLERFDIFTRFVWISAHKTKITTHRYKVTFTILQVCDQNMIIIHPMQQRKSSTLSNCND